MWPDIGDICSTPCNFKIAFIRSDLLTLDHWCCVRLTCSPSLKFEWLPISYYSAFIWYSICWSTLTFDLLHHYYQVWWLYVGSSVLANSVALALRSLATLKCYREWSLPWITLVSNSNFLRHSILYMYVTWRAIVDLWPWPSVLEPLSRTALIRMHCNYVTSKTFDILTSKCSASCTWHGLPSCQFSSRVKGKHGPKRTSRETDKRSDRWSAVRRPSASSYLEVAPHMVRNNAVCGAPSRKEDALGPRTAVLAPRLCVGITITPSLLTAQALTLAMDNSIDGKTTTV